MIWIDIRNDEYILEKKYTFDLIFSSIGIEHRFLDIDSKIENDDLIIYYSPELKKIYSNNYIWIKESLNLFNDNYLKLQPNYSVKKIELEESIKSIKDIISIFSQENITYLQEDNGFKMLVDIISDIFFMVTRYEEIICKEKDSHERFQLEESIAYKFNFLNRPIVNEQIELFLSILRKLDEKIEKKNRWLNKEFVFFLSHDIDSIFKYKDKIIRTIGIKILREKNIKDSIKLMSNSLKVLLNKEKDPFWTFDYLATLEEKNNINASYYFMCGGETGKDNYYNINNKNLKNVFKRIKDNSSEIGVHGSYNSYNNFNLLKKEVDKINEFTNLVGIRQHYLRFKVPDTWNIQAKGGLKYDTTLGYAKYAGFRGGLCTPYKPFDILNRKVIDIYEIPLIVMDGTISEAQYMGLSPKEAIEYVKEVIDRIIEVNGVFSLLWHNSSLDKNSVWNDWITVYEEIIKYAIDKNALAISGEKIIELYN